MEILIPSLISALALGALCCPALARPVDYLLSGGTITTIPTFDLTAVPDWWLSGGFAAHPAGTAATLALLFFSMEQAKGCGEDGGVLGSARIKTGTELVRGRVVPGRGDRPHRGPDAALPHGAAEPQRHVLRPAVGVACAAGGRPPAGDRHLERLVGQPGVHAVGHRPADGPPGPYVHHERQAGPPAAGAHAGDVGEPGLVGAVGGEVVAPPGWGRPRPAARLPSEAPPASPRSRAWCRTSRCRA